MLLNVLVYFWKRFQNKENEKWDSSTIYLLLIELAWVVYFSFAEIIAQKGLACQEFWIVAIVASASPIYYLTFLNELKLLEESNAFKGKVEKFWLSLLGFMTEDLNPFK